MCVRSMTEDGDGRWMAWSSHIDDEAPPPYVEPLSSYTYQRRSVDLHQRQRSVSWSLYLCLSVTSFIIIVIIDKLLATG